MNTRTSEDLEVIEEASPLAALQSDMRSLDNCVTDYQHRLSEALRSSDVPRRWAGIRLGRTTCCLFAAVALFTLLVNGLLTAIHADQQQLLQANCGIGILYALVCLSALTDMTSAKTALNSASEALHMRVLDVTEQLRELMRTRQAWVEDSTRAQWTSETARLKLQLAQQGLQSKQEMVQQQNQLLNDLRESLIASEAQANRLAQETATHAGQHSALAAQREALQADLEQLEQQRSNMLEELGHSKQQLEAHQAELTRVCEQAAQSQADLQADHVLEIEVRQSELTAITDQVCAAEQELARLQQSMSTLADEATMGEEILVEQSRKLGELQAQVDAAGFALVNINESLNLKSQEYDALVSEIETGSQQKVELHEQSDGLAQELIALRSQRDVFEKELVDLARSREATLSDQASMRQENEAAHELHSQTLGLVQNAEERLKLASEQELLLQSRVDWLLGQLGELERLASAQMVHHDQVDQLSGDIGQCESNLDRLRAQESMLQVAIEEATQRLEKITSDAAQRQQDVDQLTKQGTELAAEMEQVKRLTEECRDEYADLSSSTRNQLAERQSDLAIYEKKIEERMFELDSLAQSTADAQSELVEAQGMLKLHTTELRELQTLLAEAQQSYAATQLAEREAEQRASTLLEKAESIAQQVDARAKELSETAHEVATLQGEIRELQAVKAQFDELAGDSDHLEARLEVQRSEAIELNATITARRDLASALQAELETVQGQVAELREEFDAAELSCQAHQYQLATLKDEVARFLSAREEIDTQCQLVASEIDERYESLKQLELETGKCTAELTQLVAQRDALHDNVSDLQVQVSELQQAALERQGSIQAQEELRQARADELLDLQRRSVAELNEIHQLEAQIQQLTQQENQMQARIASLASEVEESQGIAAQWQDYIAKIKLELERLEAARDSQQNALEVMQQRTSQQEERLEAARQCTQVAEEQLYASEGERRAVEVHLKQLRDDVTRDQQQRDQILRQIDQAENLLASLQQEHADLSRSIVESRELYEVERATLQNLAKERDATRDAVESAQQAFDEALARNMDLANERILLEQEFTHLQQSNARAIEELTRVEKEQSQSEDQLRMIRTETEQSELELAHIRSAMLETRTQLDQLMGEHEQRQQLAIEISQQVDDLREQQQVASEQLRVKVAELLACESTLAQQQEQRAAVQLQLDALQAEVEQLHAQDTDLNARRAQFVTELASQQAAVSHMILQAKRARKGLQQLRTAAEEKSARMTEVENSIASGEQEIQRNRMRMEDLRAESIEMELRVQGQASKLESVDAQIAERVAALGNLEQRIESSKAAKSSMERSLSELHTEYNRQARQLKDLQSQQAQLQTMQVQAVQECAREVELLTATREQLANEATELRRAIAELQASPPIATELSIASVDSERVESELLENEPDVEADSSIEADLWSSVQQLNQVVYEARSNKGSASSSTGATACVDPWAAVLAAKM